MQQKRGPLAKLDKDQLLPGEFAIPTDSDSIYVCLSAGHVIEIPSKQAMQVLLDTLNEVVKKSETIIEDFEALEVEKAAINDNETSTVTTYSSEKIMQLIDAINEFVISIVDVLPTENIDTHTIYFVPKEESENDVYDEYIYINSAWEHIGSTEIDLSGYCTSTQVEEIKSELQNDIDDLNSDFEGIDISSDVSVMVGEVVFLDIKKTGKYIDFNCRLSGVTTTAGFRGLINLNKYTAVNVSVLAAFNNTANKPIYCMATDTYIAINDTVTDATITVNGRFRII